MGQLESALGFDSGRIGLGSKGSDEKLTLKSGQRFLKYLTLICPVANDDDINDKPF